MADIRKTARRKASKYGLDPDIYSRQIKQESGYQRKVVSPAGARGPAQITPDTAKAWGVNIYDHRVDDDLDAAAKHMAEYVKKYGYEGALRAYNAGPGAIEKSKGYAETNNYVRNILGGAKPTKGSAPKVGYTNAKPSSVGSDAKTQIALSLLGMGNLGGYGGDDLTSSLIQAAQQKKVKPAPVSGPQPTGSDISSIVTRAKQIDKERLPYKWGGGHGATPAGPGVPVDCSGAVSRLLNVSPRVSGQFEKYGKPGKGKSLTVWANGRHVLMEINGHFWGTSASNPGGGAGWIPRSQISDGYLKGFVARHPPRM